MPRQSHHLWGQWPGDRAAWVQVKSDPPGRRGCPDAGRGPSQEQGPPLVEGSTRADGRRRRSEGSAPGLVAAAAGADGPWTRLSPGLPSGCPAVTEWFWAWRVSSWHLNFQPRKKACPISSIKICHFFLNHIRMLYIFSLHKRITCTSQVYKTVRRAALREEGGPPGSWAPALSCHVFPEARHAGSPNTV